MWDVHTKGLHTPQSTDSRLQDTSRTALSRMLIRQRAMPSATPWPADARIPPHRPSCVRDPHARWATQKLATAKVRPPPVAPAVALSIAAYEQDWYLADLLVNAAKYANSETRIILHYNCRSEGLNPFGVLQREALDARISINPRCVTVRPSCGSVLHAHLLNWLHIERNPSTFGRPQYFVMQASNMRWLRSGWEGFVQAHHSTVDRSTRIRGEAPATRPVKGHPSGLHRVLPRAATALTNHTGCFVYADHEGSFWPWSVLRAFVPTLASVLALHHKQKRASAMASAPSLSIALHALDSQLSTSLQGTGASHRRVRALNQENVFRKDPLAALDEPLAALDEAPGAFEEHLLPTFYASTQLGFHTREEVAAACRRPRPARCNYGLGQRPAPCPAVLMRWPAGALASEQSQSHFFELLRHEALTNDSVFAVKVIWRHPNNTLLRAIRALPIT